MEGVVAEKACIQFVVSLVCSAGVSNTPPMQWGCTACHFFRHALLLCLEHMQGGCQDQIIAEESEKSVTLKPAKKSKCLSLGRKRHCLLVLGFLLWLRQHQCLKDMSRLMLSISGCRVRHLGTMPTLKF